MLGKPEFEKKLVETVECVESDSVSFEVKVRGVPSPVIQWYVVLHSFIACGTAFRIKVHSRVDAGLSIKKNLPRPQR